MCNSGPWQCCSCSASIPTGCGDSRGGTARHQHGTAGHRGAAQCCFCTHFHNPQGKFGQILLPFLAFCAVSPTPPNCFRMESSSRKKNQKKKQKLGEWMLSSLKRAEPRDR